eukprot:300953_1
MNSNDLHEVIQEKRICKLNQCNHFTGLNNILKQYNSFSTCSSENNNDYKVINYHHHNTVMLNDFHHLLLYHSSEFEDIYTLLCQESNNGTKCNASCMFLNRNNRNRTQDNRTLYWNHNDHHSIIQQQFLDAIHSYYFHSFHTGNKITQQDKDDFQINSSVMISKQKKCVNNQKTKRSQRFNTNIDFKDNEYSYGIRYFYWPWYKDNNHVYDDAHYQKHKGVWSHPPEANPQYRLKDWYIPPKYKCFKEELLYNAICKLSSYQWDSILLKAYDLKNTDYFRKMKCLRKDTAKCYDLEYHQPLSINQLVAIMIYCNFDVLQFKFTETFRRIDNENDCALKQRHRNYYHLGRLLRELVECFGMKWGHTKIADSVELYHGVNEHFTFSSLNAFIKCPFSTTADYYVALNFAANGGMILHLDMQLIEWKYEPYSLESWFNLVTNCFDCSFVSDFPNEQEIFFIGGLCKFTFNAIISVSKCINYVKYIKGMKQMTALMTNGDQFEMVPNPETEEEKQMIFRLFSHELWTHYPNHKYAREFKGCPGYIKNILHKHCANIKLLSFSAKHKYRCSNPLLFNSKINWINMALCLKVFPNIVHIEYDAAYEHPKFFIETSIYHYVLKYVRAHKNSELKQIDIIVSWQMAINVKMRHELKLHINAYRKDFGKCSWDIYVRLMDNTSISNNQVLSIGGELARSCRIIIKQKSYFSEEKIQFRDDRNHSPSKDTMKFVNRMPQGSQNVLLVDEEFQNHLKNTKWIENGSIANADHWVSSEQMDANIENNTNNAPLMNPTSAKSVSIKSQKNSMFHSITRGIQHPYYGSLWWYTIHILLCFLFTFIIISSTSNNTHGTFRLESLSVNDWNVDDVILSLKYHKLEQYTTEIREYYINGARLLKLSDNSKYFGDHYVDLLIYSRALSRRKIGVSLKEDRKQWHLQKVKTLNKLSKKIKLPTGRCFEKQCIVEIFNKYSFHLRKMRRHKSFLSMYYHKYFNAKSKKARKYDFVMCISGMLMFPRITLFGLTYFTLLDDERIFFDICGISFLWENDEKFTYYLSALLMYILQSLMFPEILCIRYGLNILNVWPNIFAIFILYHVNELLLVLYNIFYGKPNNIKSLVYILFNDKSLWIRINVLCASAFVGIICIELVELICLLFVIIRIFGRFII